MSCFTFIEPHHNPNEGREIINANFADLCGIIFSGVTGTTIVDAGTNIVVDTVNTFPLEYRISLSGDVIVNRFSASTYFSGSTPLTQIIQSLISGSTGTAGSNTIVSGGTGIIVTAYSGLTATTYVVNVNEYQATGVIGAAEDGTYTDGLFTDFVTGTTIGVAIDRFNEILKALAPPPAPALTDWSQLTLAQSVTGKLSFDTTNPIGGYAPADAGGIPTPVSVDGSFTLGTPTKRLGVTEKVGGSQMSGILASNVSAGPGSPFVAYPALSFGNADQGTLNLIINGVTASTINLTLSAATDTTAGGTTSGLNVSATSPVLFPSGTALDLFKYRTGTWVTKKTDLTNGYNSVIVQHNVTPINILTLTRFDVVADANTSATTYSGLAFSGLTMTGSKKLSGVDYNLGGTALYSSLIDNAYRNTYSPSASAVSFIGTRCSASAQALGTNGGNEALQVSVFNKVATITSGIRIINGTIDIKTRTLRTVQGTVDSSVSTISNILMDDVAATSTLVFEGFDDENKRLLSNSSYDFIADVASNPWDPTQSINDGSTGHTTGLQVTNGTLIYPTTAGGSLDYRTSNILNGSIFNDGGTGGTARNYTALSGNRTYYRYFQQVSPTTPNFTIVINGATGTFRAANDTTGTDWIHVEIKGPTETGWMDAYNDFVTGQFNDGNGARDAASGVGRAFGATWGLTIGTKNTANTGGYMVVRITVPGTFVGNFTNITFAFV